MTTNKFTKYRYEWHRSVYYAPPRRKEWHPLLVWGVVLPVLAAVAFIGLVIASGVGK